MKKSSDIKSGKNKIFNYFKYNEKHKIGQIETIFLLVLTFLCSFLLGFYFHDKFKSDKTVLLDSHLNKFIDNYNYIVDNYYQDVDKNVLIDDAIEGMMKALDDPYSVYLDNSKNSNVNISLNGVYRGLGLAITKDNENNYIKVVGVIKGSQAEKNGIIEGDIIKRIDNNDTSSLSITDFSSLIIKSKEDEFTLLINRDGTEQIISIEKGSVVIDSVISDVIKLENLNVGYIYISVFASNTASQFLNELKKLEKSNIDYLIIDVRNNTGGHLTTVVKILKCFLTNKQIIYQLQKNNKTTKIYGNAKSNKKYPIILMGNESSASASELLISALKENLNCKFFGKKTYGKGTVQEMITLDSNNKYKITTKRWLTPRGNWVNDTEGISPDYIIDTESYYYDDNDINKDSQLNSAIQYILKEKK